MNKVIIPILLFGLIAVLCSGRRLDQTRYVVKLTPSTDPSFLERWGLKLLGQVGPLADFQYVEQTGAFSESSLSLLENQDNVESIQKQIPKKRYPKSYNFTDPLFEDQWHLVNTGQFNGTAGQDISVSDVWNMGYSGLGVRIAIVDDGYQHSHPDLTPGYSQNYSYNFNGPTNPNDPTDPAPDVDWDYHGTSCAGVALARNNDVCGIGAAYNAYGSGIRLISDWIDDATEAMALTYRMDGNHIYSNSWGPADDGVTMEGPGPLTRQAIANGVQNGRGGLGSIYIWAAGNGLQSNDNCNYDGYVNSPEVIAVGAVDNNGVQSYYSEPCAAMLVTAPSSGSAVGITTTDLLGADGYDSTDCTSDFGGTSSATPLVAGVVALMLEANPMLTWRDVQHILVNTADKNDPTNPDWTTNGAGLHINHMYGFGRVNASAAVRAALSHKYVAAAANYSSSIVIDQLIPDNRTNGIVSGYAVSHNTMMVEQVEVIVNITHPAAGDLTLTLTSPSGTHSILGTLRQQTVYSHVNTSIFPDVTFEAVQALFGPNINVPIVGNVILSQPTEACENITNCAEMAGHIALIDRGTCSFVPKVLAAQNCGAIAVIVANNFEGYPIAMGGESSLVTISSVMVTLASGIHLKNGLANGTVGVTLYNTVYKWPTDGLVWRFTTVRNWGERAQGNWYLNITDSEMGEEGYWHDWQIIIHGTGTSNPGEDHHLLIIILATSLGSAALAALIVYGVYKYYVYKKAAYTPL